MKKEEHILFKSVFSTSSTKLTLIWLHCCLQLVSPLELSDLANIHLTHSLLASHVWRQFYSNKKSIKNLLTEFDNLLYANVFTLYTCRITSYIQMLWLLCEMFIMNCLKILYHKLFLVFIRYISYFTLEFTKN